MTTDLEPRIRELFRELADHTTITPDVHPATAAASRGRSGRDRSRWVYVTAAAATVALVTAVVIVRFTRDTTPAGPTPGSGEPVGIFPAGDAERVVAVGYRSAASVTAAYLEARFPATDSGNEMDVRVNTPHASVDGSRAIVAFDIDVAGVGLGASINGRVDARQVTNSAGDTAWAVLVMSIGSANGSDVALEGDQLTGSLSGTEPGPRVVIVRDAMTGNVLADVGFDEPRESDGEIASDAMSFDEPIRADAVIIELSNAADVDGAAGAIPEYLEMLVRAGDEPIEDAFESVYRAVDFTGSGPLAEGEMSAVRELGVSGTQPIARGDGFTLSLSGGSSQEAGGVTLDQYCVDVDMVGSGYSLCTSPASATTAHALTLIGPTSREGVGLVVGLVPDAVDSVTDATGRSIPLAHNVFYDPVSPGVHTYVLESADGSERDVMTFTYLVLGGGVLLSQ